MWGQVSNLPPHQIAGYLLGNQRVDTCTISSYTVDTFSVRRYSSRQRKNGVQISCTDGRCGAVVRVNLHGRTSTLLSEKENRYDGYYNRPASHESDIRGGARAAHPVGCGVPSGRQVRDVRADLHPHLSARAGADASVSAQPLRDAFQPDHRVKPGEAGLRGQSRGPDRMAGESGRRRNPWGDPSGSPGRQLRVPHPLAVHDGGLGAPVRATADVAGCTAVPGADRVP